MLAVLLDVLPKEIGDFFGVESVSELMIPDIKLKEHFYNELNYLGINDICFCKQQQFNSLKHNKPNDYIFLLFSHIYYEFSYLNTELIKDEILLTDDNRNIIGAVISHKRKFSSDDILTELKTLNFDKHKLTEYCKIIDSANDYKLLLIDILNKKTARKLPEIAQGVYTLSSIPKGDFTLVPPVYLGENVQIESGSVIGPNTVIMNNTLIAENSVAANSIISKNSYISDECYVENSVMCEDTSLCKNSSVFEGSVIGCHSIIGENIFIENNTKIKPYLSVKDYNSYANPFSNVSLSDFTEDFLTPDNSVALGQALGTLFLNEKIAILTDGKSSSVVMKFALLSGLLSVGAECVDFGVFFNSAIHYFSSYCEIKYSVYISSCKGEATIRIYKNNKELSNSERVILNCLIKSKGFAVCKENDYKGIRKIKGMQRMYLSFVLMKISEGISFNPVFKCSNTTALKFLDYASRKIKIRSFENITEFILNNQCNRLVIKQNNRSYPYRDIVRAVAFYCQKENIKDEEIWRYDAVYLSFVLINILENFEGDMSKLMTQTPDYYLAEREVNSKAFINNIISNINADEVSLSKEGAFVKKDNAFARIIKNNGNNLKITVESFNSEAAEEFAGRLEDLLKL